MLKSLQEIMGGGAEYALHALWSDQFSAAEAAAIQSRAKNEPRFREELDGSLEFLARVEVLADDREIQGIAQDFRRVLRERRLKRRLASGIAAGTLLAMGAVLTYFSPWSGPHDNHLQKYFTRTGEQKTIELEDGSVITLNTAGQLLVDYSRSARRVLMERGEAYFEVAHDPDRTFRVDLGLRSVTVDGTAFNIRKDPQRYQVAVIEGAVVIHGPTDEVSPSLPPVLVRGSGTGRVEAGWVAEFDLDRNELTSVRPDSMDRFHDWRNGLLSFYYEPLSTVVQELNRYSRKKILIEDASVMHLKVFSLIRVTDIDAALHGLESALPIEVTRHYDRIVITGTAGADNQEYKSTGENHGEG